MIDVEADYPARTLARLDFSVRLPNGEEEEARAVLHSYWGAHDTHVIIDALHGPATTSVQAICAALHIPCEILHRATDTFDADTATALESPQLADLIARVQELRETGQPLIGLALDADADRLGVVDETGAVLSGDAVLALLAEFCLTAAHPPAPGMLLRTPDATRLVDRLADNATDTTRLLTPPATDFPPTYQRAPEYRRLLGDPACLHSRRVEIAPAGTGLTPAVFAGLAEELSGRPARKSDRLAVNAHLTERLERILCAGDGQGALIIRGDAPYPDGIRAALCVLLLCAAQQERIGARWAQLQVRLGPAHTERLALDAPDAVRRALVNRFLRQYARGASLSTEMGQLAGCTPRYVGGIPDVMVEWALEDVGGNAAYLTLYALAEAPRVCAIAEARSTELAHRLLRAVTDRLDALLIDELRHAENAWKVVEILAATQLAPHVLADLPATLNCRLAEHAYTRLQELAHPGREAADLLRFVTDQLTELQPEKGRLLANCRLGNPASEHPVPRPPRVGWEERE